VMLSLNNVEVIYDGVILVLKGVSLEVRDGGITTVLGANRAGKTTTLRAISGLLRTERGRLPRAPSSSAVSGSTGCRPTRWCSGAWSRSSRGAGRGRGEIRGARSPRD